MTIVSGEVVEHRTPDEWAAVIRADLRRSVGGVIDAGRHLSDAKRQIAHGEWESWLRSEFGISQPTAARLMIVARHSAISNHAHGHALPSSWRTLYELSQLDAPLLEMAIADGEVTPALERKAAKVLVARYRVSAVEGGNAEPPSVDGEVGTIVADPPWRYGNTSTRGAAADHYPTMTIEDIAALEVPHKHAGQQAHLYLWTTAGHLPDAFSVMTAWGFTYKTYLVWVKPQMGMGNYFRVSTELVLFGVRGELRTSDRAIMNWFQAKRGRHSAKPEGFYDMVMKASPGPYLEMFARCRLAHQLICGCTKCRLGWQVWGNES